MYYSKGRFSYDNFNDFIKHHINKKGLEYIYKMWSGLENHEKYIDFTSIGYSGNLPKYMYNELFLLIIETKENDYYFPVIIQDINTSSAFAFCMCYCYYDDDYYDEDESRLITVDEILEKTHPCIEKNSFKKILENISYNIMITNFSDFQID